MGWHEPLTLRERTLPTPTVISRSKVHVLNYPCAPKSQNLQLVVCLSWTPIRLPRHIGFLCTQSVFNWKRYKPARSEPSGVLFEVTNAFVIKSGNEIIQLKSFC
ncbi:hypothetical protein J6590_012616 [Homalodisca vitripennis]|nr:hypothetical protein J6590_012616 [Homalodisca vitripennis]